MSKLDPLFTRHEPRICSKQNLCSKMHVETVGHTNKVPPNIGKGYEDFSWRACSLACHSWPDGPLEDTLSEHPPSFAEQKLAAAKISAREAKNDLKRAKKVARQAKKRLKAAKREFKAIAKESRRNEKKGANRTPKSSKSKRPARKQLSIPPELLPQKTLAVSPPKSAGLAVTASADSSPTPGIKSGSQPLMV
jgi:hypothetical protein